MSINWRGKYAAATAYAVADAVYYGGRFWQAVTAGTGNTPGAATAWETAALPLNAAGTWASGGTRNPGDLVFRPNGTGGAYCQWIVNAGSNTDPLTDSTSWLATATLQSDLASAATGGIVPVASGGGAGNYPSALSFPNVYTDGLTDSAPGLQAMLNTAYGGTFAGGAHGGGYPGRGGGVFFLPELSTGGTITPYVINSQLILGKFVKLLGESSRVVIEAGPSFPKNFTCAVAASQLIYGATGFTVSSGAANFQAGDIIEGVVNVATTASYPVSGGSTRQVTLASGASLSSLAGLSGSQTIAVLGNLVTGGTVPANTVMTAGSTGNAPYLSNTPTGAMTAAAVTIGINIFPPGTFVLAVSGSTITVSAAVQVNLAGISGSPSTVTLTGNRAMLRIDRPEDAGSGISHSVELSEINLNCNNIAGGGIYAETLQEPDVIDRTVGINNFTRFMAAFVSNASDGNAALGANQNFELAPTGNCGTGFNPANCFGLIFDGCAGSNMIAGCTITGAQDSAGNKYRLLAAIWLNNATIRVQRFHTEKAIVGIWNGPLLGTASSSAALTCDTVSGLSDVDSVITHYSGSLVATSIDGGGALATITDDEVGWQLTGTVTSYKSQGGTFASENVAGPVRHFFWTKAVAASNLAEAITLGVPVTGWEIFITDAYSTAPTGAMCLAQKGMDGNYHWFDGTRTQITS